MACPANHAEALLVQTQTGTILSATGQEWRPTSARGVALPAGAAVLGQDAMAQLASHGAHLVGSLLAVAVAGHVAVAVAVAASEAVAVAVVAPLLGAIDRSLDPTKDHLLRLARCAAARAPAATIDRLDRRHRGPYSCCTTSNPIWNRIPVRTCRGRSTWSNRRSCCCCCGSQGCSDCCGSQGC